MSEQKTINAEMHFSCPLYTIECPEFLEIVSKVSEENLDKIKKDVDLNDLYPVYMTDSFFADERIEDFVKFVGQTAWGILDDQGYDMKNFNLEFSEMWTQEHHKHSLMEQHVHGFGSQMVGFYFLETPENCSKVMFHDPRSGKIQSSLPEKDPSVVSLASEMINFEPKPGLLIFANSWLPHSFSRHASDKPLKFVHFNLFAFPAVMQNEESEVEVI